MTCSTWRGRNPVFFRMNEQQDLEEKLRESACTGDLESVKALVETQNVNVNSQNLMNKWYWYCSLSKVFLHPESDNHLATAT